MFRVFCCRCGRKINAGGEVFCELFREGEGGVHGEEDGNGEFFYNTCGWEWDG